MSIFVTHYAPRLLSRDTNYAICSILNKRCSRRHLLEQFKKVIQVFDGTCPRQIAIRI